ncbi:unnamed protein product, partial [Prunus brigantina]
GRQAARAPHGSQGLHGPTLKAHLQSSAISLRPSAFGHQSSALSLRPSAFGHQPPAFFLFSLGLTLCTMYIVSIIMRTYFSVDVAHYSGEPRIFVSCMHAYILTECTHILRVLTFSIHLIFKLI